MNRVIPNRPRRVANDARRVRLGRKLASLALLAAISSAGGVAAMAAPASALTPPPHPRCPAGTSWDGSNCVPTPPIPPPAIYGLFPSFGSPGDAVLIGGTTLGGATSVTFAGVPVPSFTASDSEIATTVPAIPWQGYGTFQIPVVVVTPQATLTATYTLSTALSATSEASWFSTDGQSTAATTLTLDRASGLLAGWTIIQNRMRWWSLSVKVSVLFADKDGKMVGYTAPYLVTAGPCYLIACSDYTTAGNFVRGPLVIQPNAGAAGAARSIQLVQVRDPNSELAATLAAYSSAGMRVADVLFELSGRFS